MSSTSLTPSQHASAVMLWHYGTWGYGYGYALGHPPGEHQPILQPLHQPAHHQDQDLQISPPTALIHSSQTSSNTPDVTMMPPLHRAEDKSKALSALKEAVEAVACPSLTETAKQLVFGHGDPNSAIMIIGEAPGAEEDEQGVPFVGASGRLLESMLASVHIARHHVYMTNVIPWRPPFNRPPTSEEIKIFAPWLWRHIAIVQPQFLICVGATSTKAVLKISTPLMNTQGIEYTYQCPYGNISFPAWTLYHPAYLLRVPGQKKTAWAQLQQIAKTLQERGLLAPPQPGNQEPTSTKDPAHTAP
jgi:uracil-DNA glycosylase